MTHSVSSGIQPLSRSSLQPCPGGWGGAERAGQKRVVSLFGPEWRGEAPTNLAGGTREGGCPAYPRFSVSGPTEVLDLRGGSCPGPSGHCPQSLQSLSPESWCGHPWEQGRSCGRALSKPRPWAWPWAHTDISPCQAQGSARLQAWLFPEWNPVMPHQPVAPANDPKSFPEILQHRL